MMAERESFSARQFEVITLDDPSLINEQVFLFLSLRHLLYVGGAAFFAYFLISSGKLGGEIIGVLLILIAAIFAFYPTKSLKLEARVVGMLDYMLSSSTEKGKEEGKNKKKDRTLKSRFLMKWFRKKKL